MLRKRKEIVKESDGECKSIDGDNSKRSGKKNDVKQSIESSVQSRVNLITGLVTIILIVTTFTARTVYKLSNNHDTIDLNMINQILMSEDNVLIKNNGSTLTNGNKQISSDNNKPRVWITGRNMETGYLRHVIDAFDRLGYQQVDGSTQDWDVLWSHDYPFGKEFFTSLKPHQKVNHFPGSGYITNKVSLATTSMPHIPKAFHLPKEKDKFISYAKTNPDRLWVKKSNNHRGIRIEKIDQMNLDETGHFVQEYIQNPLLIDGKKFDIGLYVIQTSINPLRVYIYDKDALLRWCANKYQPFNSSDYDSYVVGDDYTPIWEMPSLSKYFTELNYNMKQTLNIYLKSIGKEPEIIWTKIEEAIANVYREKETPMGRLSTMAFPKSNRNFFEMVRFDFLVDEDLNVYLMEANMSPNLSSAHFAPNKLLYEQVIYNLFSLVGLTRLDGIKNWNHYDSDSWNLRVSDKDLAVNEDLCVSDECFMSCRSESCRSCYMCLSDDLKLTLKDAYLEHNSRWNSKRLLPSTEDNSINPTNAINQIQIDWFNGKCSVNSDWCS